MKKLNKENDVMEKLESMDNKLDIITTEITNINRIQSLANTDVIIEEIRKLIHGSKVRAAILYLTSEKIGTKELSDALGIDESNLARDLAPFLGTRRYLILTREGTKKFYTRAQIVDLIGYESIDEFMDMVKAWQAKRENEKKQTKVPEKEEKVADGN